MKNITPLLIIIPCLAFAALSYWVQDGNKQLQQHYRDIEPKLQAVHKKYDGFKSFESRYHELRKVKDQEAAKHPSSFVRMFHN